MSKSWAPEVYVEGKWSRNAVRFATEEEAKHYAKDLYNRWSLTTGHRATESTREPNYRLVDGRLEAIPASEVSA